MIARHRPLVVAAIALCVVVAAVSIARTWYAGVNDVEFSGLRWRFVGLAAVCSMAFVLAYGVCWWMLLCAIPGGRAPFVATMRLFLLAWPGRYVPGSLGYYGGRLIAGTSLGCTRSSLATSLVYENLLVIATSGSLALLLLLIWFRDHVAGGAWFGLAVAAVVSALAVLHPVAMRTAIRIMSKRVARLRSVEDAVLPVSAVARLIPAYAVGTVLAGLAFYFALRSVSPTNDVPLLLAVAAYNIGGVAGILAVPVPSGIGVREGVTVVVLGAVVSAPLALSAAVLARLIAVGADLAPFCAIVAVEAAGAVRRPRRVLVERA